MIPPACGCTVDSARAPSRWCTPESTWSTTSPHRATPNASPARSSASLPTPSWRSSPVGSRSVKGVDVLVQAFAKVAAEVPGARLVVVGAPSLSADPVDAARYARTLRDLGAGLEILWLEARKNVEPLIQMADVVVAPSRWAEPFSRSVIEPLACGVPVVATGSEATPRSSRTGWPSTWFPPTTWRPWPSGWHRCACGEPRIRSSAPGAAMPWSCGSPSARRSTRSRRRWRSWLESEDGDVLRERPTLQSGATGPSASQGGE